MNYTCVVCPQSCDLTLLDDNGNLTVTGAGCKRGVEYAKSEYTFPKRTITTTVAIEGANIKRLAAISSSAVPKEALSQCLEYLYGIVVKAPVKMGDVIVKDLLGTGADIVAARSIYASNKSEESR